MKKWANCSFFAHFLFFCERCEWIGHFAQIKWAMWANRSGRTPKMSKWVNRSFFWANRSFAHFWTKKRAIRSKIKLANSQPWLFFTIWIYWNIRRNFSGCCHPIFILKPLLDSRFHWLSNAVFQIVLLQKTCQDMTKIVVRMKYWFQMRIAIKILSRLFICVKMYCLKICC